MTRLTLNGVAKRFGRRILFRKLSVGVDGGQALAITGSNGSGKSTLLKIIAGVMTPTKGEVSLQLKGKDITPEDRPLQMGFVSPYLNVYDGFTARENLAFIAKVRRLANAQGLIDELITSVSLKGRENDLVKTYSSGMKQRVKFAAAMLTSPAVLILDEPTTNLDVAGIKMVKELMQRQKDRDGIIILASNDAEEVTWCDTSIDVEDHR
ncbi:MAG: heme ABC exporter ATP-binding protein CcmA [Rhodothermales bacterium]